MVKELFFRIEVVLSANASAKTRAACAESIKRPSDEHLTMSSTEESRIGAQLSNLARGLRGTRQVSSAYEM